MASSRSEGLRGSLGTSRRPQFQIYLFIIHSFKFIHLYIYTFIKWRFFNRKWRFCNVSSIENEDNWSKTDVQVHIHGRFDRGCDFGLIFIVFWLFCDWFGSILGLFWVYSGSYSDEQMLNWWPFQEERATMMNFVLKTRHFVLKTRNVYFVLFYFVLFIF